MTEPSWRQQRKKQISENINKDPVEIETQGVSAPPEMLPRVGPVRHQMFRIFQMFRMFRVQLGYLIHIFQKKETGVGQGH